MTTSTFDNEAMNAVRMVNAILAQHKMTWEEFLQKSSDTGVKRARTKQERGDPNPFDDGYQCSGDEQPKTELDWGEVIEGILYRRGRKMAAGPKAFLNSVLVFWKTNGRLSEKQEAAIRKFR